MKVADIFCEKHPETKKVAMRNMKNAPVLGCPVCHPQQAPVEIPPEPQPLPQPTPAPAQARRGFTLIGRARSLANG